MVYLVRKNVPNRALHTHEMEKVLLAIGENVVNRRIRRRLRFDVPDDIDGAAIGVNESIGNVVCQADGCPERFDHIAVSQKGSGPQRLVHKFYESIGRFRAEALRECRCSPDDFRIQRKLYTFPAAEAKVALKVCRVRHDTAAPRGGRRNR